MASLSVLEAQANLPTIVHRLAPGEEVILTENDQPIAKLVATAVQPRPTPRLGTQRGSVLSMKHFDDPLEEFEDYR